MNASLGMDLIRSLFATIDKAVYGLIKVLYDILLQLAETNIFTNENIQEFSTRIYVFLGIIMLFKVTFSLIQYLINPDSMNDKTNGTGNLAKNIIITLFLIIIVPYGFDLLYSAQSAIIKDNLIPRLVLGTEKDSLDNLSITIDNNQCKNIRNEIDNNGDYIALMTLRPFYQVYEGQTLSDTTKQVFCSAKRTDDLLIDEIYNAETGVLNNGQYIVDYSFFLSTACGVLVMLLLLEFCFDVAMRCVKLGFLEIFAPVAIITFIDPKSSKSGTFSKWLKEVFGTWARLFIRLLILFFAVYIIKIVNENVGDYSENGMWIMLFLIIGALLFAKKAVPLIEDLLGIKFDHSIQLNPFKKISDQALFGKQIAGLPGKALAGTVGLATSTGGAIAGHILKGSKVRDAKGKLSHEQAKLNELKNQMRTNIDNYKMLEGLGVSEDVLKKARLNAINSGYSWRNQQDKVLDAQKNLENEKEELKKKNSDNEGNLYFSYQHPIISTITQALRGAKIGFSDKEAEKIAKAVTIGIESARKSAKMTNDFDKFGYLDRLKDLGTDLTGVKNESGTTSIVKKEMKEQTELLNNIRNAIASLEHSFGNLKPGAINFDDKGNMSVNQNFSFSDPSEKTNIESLIAQYESLRKSEKATAKQIKEYEDVLAINAKKDK